MNSIQNFASLTIANKGPLLVETNYWESQLAQEGCFFLSVNAGAFRLLIPRQCENALPDMTTNVSHVVISRTQYEPLPRTVVLELLFDDGSEQPYALGLSMPQLDRLAPKSDDKRRVRCALYVNRDGPKLVFETDAFFQVVPHIPWTKRINPRHFRA